MGNHTASIHGLFLRARAVSRELCRVGGIVGGVRPPPLCGFLENFAVIGKLSSCKVQLMTCATAASSAALAAPTNELDDDGQADGDDIGGDTTFSAVISHFRRNASARDGTHARSAPLRHKFHHRP